MGTTDRYDDTLHKGKQAFDKLPSSGDIKKCCGLHNAPLKNPLEHVRVEVFVSTLPSSARTESMPCKRAPPWCLWPRPKRDTHGKTYLSRGRQLSYAAAAEWRPWVQSETTFIENTTFHTCKRCTSNFVSIKCLTVQFWCWRGINEGLRQHILVIFITVFLIFLWQHESVISRRYVFAFGYCVSGVFLKILGSYDDEWNT